MNFDYHIIVIGAGSGGLVVAAGAASMGARVALIEEDRMGGDCLNFGCVPSKSFLKPAHLAAEAGQSKKLGLDMSLRKVNLAAVMKRVQSVIKAIEPHDSVERFESLGVNVIKGKGILSGANTVQVGKKNITGKYIVIATGSGPALPPVPGLDTVPYITNKTIFKLKKLPRKLIVMGGGPIGLELGQGMRHLGSQVEVIDMLDHLFPKDDPEVAPLMEEIFTREGIKLSLSTQILEVKKSGRDIVVVIEKDGTKQQVKGDQLLVSLGRWPVSKGLGLEDVGVRLSDRGYVEVDDYLRTNIKNIFACGDVVGPYQFTHMAGYQAGIILRNIMLPVKKAKVNYSAVPWTTYTRPEVAHVGYTEPWAQQEKKFKDVVLIELGEIDRARAEDDEAGFLKLIIGKKGRLIGATMVGNRAGEIMPLASLAITKGLKATAFMSVIFSYPTEAEIFKMASLEIAKRSLKPWMKTVVQKLFLR